ncbi:hypothetical protein Dsin_032893 [Dipteronia sinensis]|uniref:RRM domain-containing protein n=1 Tax=Dipteronia sinensis TaxID=43782 RepID=A0AAD9ZFF1_9ROSI|nr:hypothetical protein Dsin_032893 [Dipteronia sinensis]
MTLTHPRLIALLQNNLHISSLAGPQGTDSVKVFYLDSIRTHAFVSFISISAAARVRNSMHGTRFPDELMRDTLWIDFIPDEKVQDWIDEETGDAGGGFGGGRSSSRKYEHLDQLSMHPEHLLYHKLHPHHDCNIHYIDQIDLLSRLTLEKAFVPWTNYSAAQWPNLNCTSNSPANQ